MGTVGFSMSAVKIIIRELRGAISLQIYPHHITDSKLKDLGKEVKSHALHKSHFIFLVSQIIEKVSNCLFHSD